MEKKTDKKTADYSHYNYFGVVINEPKENPLDLANYLEGYETSLHELPLAFLATIIHDKDQYTKQDEQANAEHKEGTPKRRHLHAFFQVAESMTQGQALKWLSKALNVDKEQVSIEGSNSDILLCQYLAHKNHPQKAQYSTDLIKTTNRERLDIIMSKEYQKPKTENDIIIEALEKSDTFKDLVYSIGIDKANKYRPSFDRFKEDSKRDYKSLADNERRLRKRLADAHYQLAKLVSLWRHKSISKDDIDEASLVADDIKSDIDGY